MMTGQAAPLTQREVVAETQTADATQEGLKWYGARAYLNADGGIQVKQTVKDAADIVGQYVIDYDAKGNQRQRSVDAGPNQDAEVGQVVRLALNGQLGARPSPASSSQ